jgi:hypothetical protein
MLFFRAGFPVVRLYMRASQIYLLFIDASLLLSDYFELARRVVLSFPTIPGEVFPEKPHPCY